MIRTLHITAEVMDLISGRGTKIPQAAWCGQKKKVYIPVSDVTLICNWAPEEVFQYAVSSAGG